MTRLQLFIDTTSNSLIAGLNSLQSVNPSSLPLFYGDTIQLQVTLLNTTGTTLQSINPYVVIPTAGIQLFLYLDDGVVGGTIYTQQITWSTDPTNTYFYATLSLNTAALTTLLGSSTSANAWLKIGFVQAGYITTVLSSLVKIQVGLPNVALAVPANLTPLSLEVANALFIHADGNQANPGQPVLLVSPNGKIIALTAKDNPDGTAEFDASPVN